MSAGGVGGAGGARADFEYDHPEVLDGAPAVSAGAGSEAAAVSRTSIRPPVSGDNFAGFAPQRVTLASDDGPAFVSGNFNRSVYGDFTINRGKAEFTRKVFNQQPEPSRQLTAAEKTDLAKSFEAAIARGGPLARDLRVALAKLNWTAPPISSYDFSRWQAKSVAIAADGGPVSLRGEFPNPIGPFGGPPLAGNITIRNGTASYSQPGSDSSSAVPSTPLTPMQKNQLANSLERQIAAGGPMKRDLQYALAELNATPPDPAPFGRDYTTWKTKSVAIAADGGPATLAGDFGGPDRGAITIRNGEARYAQTGSTPRPFPSEPLTADDKRELQRSLERQIAAGGPMKRDLEYALAELKRSAPPAEPDLPVTLTEAIGEFGREVAGLLEKRLESENDAGLQRTLDAFLARGAPRGAEDYDFNSAIGKLAEDKKLDDLALELAVQDREFKHLNPNVRHYGRLDKLNDAVERSGNAHVKQEWTRVSERLRNMPLDAPKDGRMAGTETARELATGLERKDAALLARAAKGLVPTGTGNPAFVRAKLNAALQAAARRDQLDDVVKALGKTAEGRQLLDELGACVKQQGTAKTKQVWRAAGGGDGPRIVTTMMVGEEGRGPIGPP